MPKNYAKRFAEFIAADPEVASDYAIQLYSEVFAEEVAAELVKMGFQTRVDIHGKLTVHVPDDHPTATEAKKKTLGLHWPRKPEDRSSQWSLSPLLAAV